METGSGDVPMMVTAGFEIMAGGALVTTVGAAFETMTAGALGGTVMGWVLVIIA